MFLFIDIVGYSKLLTKKQRSLLEAPEAISPAQESMGVLSFPSRIKSAFSRRKSGSTMPTCTYCRELTPGQPPVNL